MKNTITKTFYHDESWNTPPGVKRVKASVVALIPSQLSAGDIDLIANETLATAIREDGAAIIWGKSSDGADGTGAFEGVSGSSPYAFGGLGLLARQMNAYTHSVAVGLDGNLYATGLNSFGQLGLGNTVSRSSPVAVIGGRLFCQVAVSSGSTVALDLNKDAYSFGANANGQLGDGTVTHRSSPVAVIGGHKWLHIARSTTGCMALKHDGAAFGWGHNSNGTLGDGTTAHRSSPTAVIGGRLWLAIAGGGGHTLAIDKETGYLYAWGWNSMGQLGTGDTDSRSSPVLVDGTKRWLAVAAGYECSHAIDENRDMYSFGRNFTSGGEGVVGSLGDGTTTDRSTPTLVIGNHKWLDVAGSGGITVGLRTDGKIMGWGRYAGDGTTSPRSSPVLVAGVHRYNRQTEVVVAEKVVDLNPPGQSNELVIYGEVVRINQTFLYGNESLKLALRLEYQN